MSVNLALAAWPALLTRMCTGPKRARAAAKAHWMEAASRDVGGDGQGVVLPERAGQLRKPGQVAREQGDLRPVCDQGSCDHGTDAAACTGDHCMPPGKDRRAHELPPVWTARARLRSSWLLPERYWFGHHCGS